MRAIVYNNGTTFKACGIMNVNSDAVNILTAIRAVVISHSAQSFSLCRKGAVAGCVCLPNKNTLCLSTVTEYKEQLCVVMSSSLHEETVSHTGVSDFFFSSLLRSCLPTLSSFLLRRNCVNFTLASWIFASSLY